MEFSKDYILKLEYDLSKMPIEQLRLMSHLVRSEIERKEFRRRANEIAKKKDKQTTFIWWDGKQISLDSFRKLCSPEGDRKEESVTKM